MTENPNPDSNLPYQSPPQGQRSGGPLALSIASLAVGLFSCPASIIPICGCPFGIAGIICGALALKGAKAITPNGHIKGMAIAGLVLSSIGMLITIANAAWGAYLGAQGKLFKP